MRKLIFIGFCVVGVLLGARLGLAEVVLWKAGSSEKKPSGMYTQSRFGHAPFEPQIQPMIMETEGEVDTSQGDGREIASAATLSPEKIVPSSLAPVQQISLIIGDSGYFPETLMVTRDIPVHLFVTTSSKKEQCLIQDEFQVRRQVRPNRIEEVKFTPAHAGLFHFYCPINGMRGSLVVKE